MDTIVKQIGDFRMHLLRKDPGISRALARGYTNREEGFVELIENTVEPGHTAFELGGNIGYITLKLSRLVGPEGQVLVAEPDPTNVPVLKQNLELNKCRNVKLYPVAISDTPGEATFYRSKSSNLGSMINSENATEPIKVRTESVDSICLLADIRPNFYKMDIEGAEVQALSGMVETLKRSPSPVRILLETHVFAYNEGNSLEKVVRKLFGMGFRCKYVLSAALIRPKLFKQLGYKPVKKYTSESWHYALYDNISDEDMIQLACYEHQEFVFYRLRYTNTIVRAILLEK
jgi:FkbM family methyltransferase